MGGRGRGGAVILCLPPPRSYHSGRKLENRNLCKGEGGSGKTARRRGEMGANDRKYGREEIMAWCVYKFWSFIIERKLRFSWILLLNTDSRKQTVFYCILSSWERKVDGWKGDGLPARLTALERKLFEVKDKLVNCILSRWSNRMEEEELSFEEGLWKA